MKTIFSTVKLKKAALAGLLVLVLASSLCQMLLPAFLSQMISRGVAAGADSVILIYGTVMAGITVLSCIISFLSVKTASSVSTDFAAQLRTKVFSSVLEFSAAEMDHFGTASLITRSTSDIANVQNFLTMLLRIGLMAPMMAAAGLGIFCIYRRKSQLCSSDRHPCFTGCADPSHYPCIPLFCPPAEKAGSHEPSVSGVFGRSPCHPRL